MSKRGHDRERRVADWLRDRDWLVVRAAGSFGPADLVALRAGSTPLLVEVKSTISPYSHFLPADRARMLKAAELAGADATLAWWPSRGSLVWIDASAWPVKLEAVEPGELVA